MTVRAAALLLVSGLSCAAAAAPRAGQLPAGVVPIHYDIAIDPDAKALAFTGQETITVEAAAPTRSLVLNAADLTIGGVRVDGAVARWSIDDKAQRLTITPAHALKPGVHRIAIGWTGKISQSAAGLFAIDYKDSRGAQRMLVTQFEPSDARRFAPLWDEPGRKATFTLTTIAPAGQTAFSNMPVATTAKAADGRTRFTFQPTPKMSSYLLFLGQGDVERRTAKLGETEIGVITRRGAGDQGAYALASAKRLLAYYNDYFGTPYPLPKLDMIAGPGSSQFFGAMENWGAIFYFERDILLDPALSTENNRQRVFTTVAHEMAHQWFGDLVTMAWWDDLWLNEGFAEWMDGKASAALNPDWHLDEQLIAGARRRAFQADSRQGTHPIVQKIDTPEQANQAFDSITYLKGEAVIRMLEGAVGESAFRDGVRRYMAAHKYGNTVTDDLWASIAAASGKPVKPLMDAFTRKEGVPLIRVGEPVCDAGQTRLTLAQDRFGTDDSGKVPQLWPVPVALKGNSLVQLDVSGAAPKPVTVPGCAPVVVNPGQYGYYRTLYTPAHFEALGRGFAALSLADQVGTLLDRFALADAGYAPLDDALALLPRVPVDADPLVWTAIADRIAAYDALLSDDPAQAAFRARAGALLAPQLARVGFIAKPGEAPPVSQLRETVIATLGALGDSRVVAEARRLVAGGMNTIPSAIRQPMVTIFAENASPADWDMLHAAARAETNPLIRQSLYQNLGRAKDEALTRRALDLALTDEAPVPLRVDVIAAAATRHAALVFDWAVAHADTVNALVEPSARQQVIPNFAAAANDAATADRLEAYVNRAIPVEARRSSAATIGQIRYAARVKARVRAPLAAWAAAR